MRYLLALINGMAMKISILFLVVSVHLFNVIRADEPTYRRIRADERNPIRGLVLTADWHPLRVKNKNIYALFNTTIHVVERQSFEQSFTDQVNVIAQSVTRLGINKEGKIHLSYQDQPKSNNAIVFVKVAEVDQSLVLEYVVDVKDASQFQAYQNDEVSSRSRESTKKTVLFEYVNNHQIPTELYIGFQSVAKADPDHEINTKQLVLLKKQEAAVFQLVDQNKADDK